jgi:copper chaperone CopZ
MLKTGPIVQPGAELHLSVEGMHCQGCVNRLSAALARLEDVEVLQVEVGSARLQLAPGVSPQTVLDAVARSGFSARPES